MTRDQEKMVGGIVDQLNRCLNKCTTEIIALKQQRDEYARALVEACTKQENWQDHELVNSAYEKAKHHLNNEEEK